jgi:hypothetical protein
VSAVAELPTPVVRRVTGPVLVAVEHPTSAAASFSLAVDMARTHGVRLDLVGFLRPGRSGFRFGLMASGGLIPPGLELDSSAALARELRALVDSAPSDLSIRSWVVMASPRRHLRKLIECEGYGFVIGPKLRVGWEPWPLRRRHRAEAFVPNPSW